MSTIIDLTDPIFNELHNCTFESIESKEENDKSFEQHIHSLMLDFGRSASDGYLFWDKPEFILDLKYMLSKQKVCKELKVYCERQIVNFKNFTDGDEVIRKYKGTCHGQYTKEVPVKIFIDGLVPQLNAILECVNQKIDYNNTFILNRANYLAKLDELDTNHLYTWLSKTCERIDEYSIFENLWNANFESITIVEKPNELNNYKYIFEMNFKHNKYYFYAYVYNKTCRFYQSM